MDLLPPHLVGSHFDEGLRIEALFVAYADCPDLLIKHKYYLNMISWAKEDPTAKITQAFPCLINMGTLDAHLPARIYVDDALLLGLLRQQMELKLAALIRAIFVIMGKPDMTVRQCPLAMDKWLDLVVAPKQMMLGHLTVGIAPDYVAEVFDLLNTADQSDEACRGVHTSVSGATCRE